MKENQKNRQVKSWKELADEYGVHVNTIRKWVKPIYPQLHVTRKKVLHAWQVKMIHEFLDNPHDFEFIELQ